MSAEPRLKVERLAIPGLLAPVDLALAAGEILCLSGPSGAGKSRLLRAIADLEPHSGRLWLDGTPSEAMTPEQWRSRVGLLPAESGWWADRVEAHFRHPPAADALAELGFNTAILQQRVDRLSSGERQRLALLRLLANQPRVLLLDEPTANLDPANVRRVEDLLLRYRSARNAALLWVSHDPEQIERIADRHLDLQDGRLHPATVGAAA